jgi:hypothetical protein
LASDCPLFSRRTIQRAVRRLAITTAAIERSEPTLTRASSDSKRFIQRTTVTEAMMIMEFFVQVVVSAAVLVMVILFVAALDSRATPRERVLRRVTGRHWWNRTRHGP